jgi:hypothetical protein
MLRCRPKLRRVSFVVKTFSIRQLPPHGVHIPNYNNSVLHGNRTATEIQLTADNYVHIHTHIYALHSDDTRKYKKISRRGLYSANI